MPAKLRALIVEDEWPARNYLVELLEGSGDAAVIGAVATTAEARQVLESPLERGALDVVFVDINLSPEGNTAGLEFVRSQVNVDGPNFVLATALQSHALEAFDLGVVDYLLKPFTEERVKQCLRRLKVRVSESVPPPALRIVARNSNTLVFLDLSDVWAFEAADRLTFVHTVHGQFDLDLSLSSIEASFGRTLTRTHRSWLVNPMHLRELERDGSETRVFVGPQPAKGDTNLPGIRVPVARDRAQHLRDALLSTATGLRRR